MTARWWTVLAAALVTGCASPQSCPAVALGSGVHVDAAAWVGAPLSPAAVKATVCVGTTCVTAAPITKANPDDLFGFVGLTSGRVTVRVKLTAPDGRSLDLTTTADVTLNKPFGAGCGGRPEVDLSVTRSGTLAPGQPGRIG